MGCTVSGMAGDAAWKPALSDMGTCSLTALAKGRTADSKGKSCVSLKELNDSWMTPGTASGIMSHSGQKEELDRGDSCNNTLEVHGSHQGRSRSCWPIRR